MAQGSSARAAIKPKRAPHLAPHAVKARLAACKRGPDAQHGPGCGPEPPRST